MVDDTAKQERFNLKVGGEVIDWIKDEQQRVRKATGKQPTQNDVMLALIDSHVGRKHKRLDFPNVETHNTELSDENRKYLEMCAAVLESGNEVALKAVKSNLDLFYLFIRRDSDAQPVLPLKRPRPRS